MHKVFISYHHANDQSYKNALIKYNDEHRIFIDGSVDTGEISDDLTDEAIREKIRDDFLADSTVTIVLVGTETKNRKHVDWEIYSSMRDGLVNKKSGILAITLPTTNCTHFTAAHTEEKQIVYPDVTSWTSITERSVYEQRYPYLPARIIDNLLAPKAKVSVTNWDRLTTPQRLSTLIECAYNHRAACEYDLRRSMRRADS